MITLQKIVNSLSTYLINFSRFFKILNFVFFPAKVLKFMRDRVHGWRPNYWRVRHFFPDISRQRLVAASTAPIIAARKLFFSRWWSPLAVLPAGDVTLSLSAAGCEPDSIANFPDPITVCDAKRYAKSLGSPILTPPSASASISTKICERNRESSCKQLAS